MEEIIRNNLILGSPNTKGWHPILCKVCNDHGRKGPRAAFVFNAGGCTYNCFNCGASASYHPYDEQISDDMLVILRAFDIPDIDWQTVVFKNLGVKSPDANPILESIIPDEIRLPHYFYPLIDDPNDDWCQYSIEYLSNRQIDWTSQPFYCVTDQNKKWYGRLVLPIYYNNRLVFYQGRDLTDLHKKKYLNPSCSRDKILYGYHNIQKHSDEPLFITEGWFDAVLLEGAAVFGNKMTAQQIQWLNRTNRRKVVIPDRYGDGHLLARQALNLGWSVSTLDMNDECKDVNESINKRGMLFTVRSLYDNICEGSQAQIITNLYCSK